MTKNTKSEKRYTTSTIKKSVLLALFESGCLAQQRYKDLLNEKFTLQEIALLLRSSLRGLWQENAKLKKIIAKLKKEIGDSSQQSFFEYDESFERWVLRGGPTLAERGIEDNSAKLAVYNAINSMLEEKGLKVDYDRAKNDALYPSNIIPA